LALQRPFDPTKDPTVMLCIAVKTHFRAKNGVSGAKQIQLLQEFFLFKIMAFAVFSHDLVLGNFFNPTIVVLQSCRVGGFLPTETISLEGLL
jgi:hypothetical protein